MCVEIKAFEHRAFGKIRVFEIDGEIWFVAADVANALGYRSANDLVRNLSDDEKGRHLVPTPGGNQMMTTINEAGFYHTILMRKAACVKDPEARAWAEDFQHWACHELIPTVRRSGAYVNPAIAPTREEKLAEAVLLANEVNKEKEQRIQELEAERMAMLPKAAFADAVAGSQDGMLIGTLAAYLNENGVSIGRNRLFKQLREEGYLHKRGQAKNLPTQKSLNLGLMSVRECVIHTPFGDKICHTALVTGRGQQYFLGKYADVGQQYRQLPPGEEVSL